MDVEAVVLTGGASTRMGRDKASIRVNNMPQAELILSSLRSQGLFCTVLGRIPISGFAYLPDKDEYHGPLSALKYFEPSYEFVFVTSCDVPKFDSRIVGLLTSSIAKADACVSVLSNRRQPLCAVYRREVFLKMKEFPGKSISAFVSTLNVVEVDERTVVDGGIDILSLKSANTETELTSILSDGVKV